MKIYAIPKTEQRGVRHLLGCLCLSAFVLSGASVEAQESGDAKLRVCEAHLKKVMTRYDLIEEVPELSYRAPRTLTPDRQAAVTVCDLYLADNPVGEKVAKIKYFAAHIYYDANHFDKAIPRFEDIVRNHPKNRLAVIAANLHLDALQLTNNFDGLNRALDFYHTTPAPIQDEQFIARISYMFEKGAFRRCNRLENTKEWESAANCFINFSSTFPNSKLVDKALYNAALDYEGIKQIGKAIEVRKRLVEERPDSALVPNTLFAIGANYQALASYNEAIVFYEIFVEHFPKEEKTEEALRNAALFHYMQGQYDEAIANYTKYMMIFPAKKEHCAEMFFRIATLYERQGKKKEAFKQHKMYIKKFAKVGRKDSILEVHTRIGMFLWNAGRHREAMVSFEAALTLYDHLREGRRKDLTSGADAAAQARFMQGEARLLELSQIKLRLPEKKLTAALKKKFEGYEEAKLIYIDVITFGRPEWSIAALYRIGLMYQDFADEVRGYSMPTKRTPDQEDVYTMLVEDQAARIEEKAVEAYEKCLSTAQDLEWFSNDSKKAERALEGWKGHGKSRGIGVQPIYFRPGLGSVLFIEKTPLPGEEARL